MQFLPLLSLWSPFVALLLLLLLMMMLLWWWFVRGERRTHLCVCAARVRVCFGDKARVKRACCAIVHLRSFFHWSLEYAARCVRYGFQLRLLMTGTPLQNNTQELWSLLNFIESRKFPDMDKFQERFGDIKSPEQVQEEKRKKKERKKDQCRLYLLVQQVA